MMILNQGGETTLGRQAATVILMSVVVLSGCQSEAQTLCRPVRIGFDQRPASALSPADYYVCGDKDYPCTGNTLSAVGISYPAKVPALASKATPHNFQRGSRHTKRGLLSHAQKSAQSLPRASTSHDLSGKDFLSPLKPSNPSHPLTPAVRSLS